MKTTLLIILLTLSVSVSGQDHNAHRMVTGTEVRAEVRSSMVAYIDWCKTDSLDLRPNMPCNETTILHGKTYAQLRVWIYDYIPRGYDLRALELWVSENKIRYLYRQPTFEGYVEWLEKSIR